MGSFTMMMMKSGLPKHPLDCFRHIGLSGLSCSSSKEGSWTLEVWWYHKFEAFLTRESGRRPRLMTYSYRGFWALTWFLTLSWPLTLTVHSSWQNTSMHGALSVLRASATDVYSKQALTVDAKHKKHRDDRQEKCNKNLTWASFLSFFCPSCMFTSVLLSILSAAIHTIHQGSLIKPSICHKRWVKKRKWEN